MKKKTGAPAISAYLNLNSRNLPDNYYGLTNESWNIGKNEPLELSMLVTLLAKKVFDFYATCMIDTDEHMNEQIQKAALLISTLRMQKEQDNVSQNQ